jgi:hypothetical protein
MYRSLDLQRYAPSQTAKSNNICYYPTPTTKVYTLVEPHEERMLSFAFPLLLLESDTAWAKPLSLGQLFHAHTAKVIPLDLALPYRYECERVIQTKHEYENGTHQTGV